MKEEQKMFIIAQLVNSCVLYIGLLSKAFHPDAHSHTNGGEQPRKVLA